MKKVAILLPWLKMGGTNKIALNFMKELSQYCEVTLILSDNSGELLTDDIVSEVQLIIDNMKDFRSIFFNDLKRLRIGYLFRDMMYYIRVRRGKDSVDNYKYIVDRNEYIMKQEYDCAISYHGQSPERLLNLIYRIHSKKKVVWIHGEMSFSKDKCECLKKYYEKIDQFFFVSEPTMESFYRAIPLENPKGIVYRNPIDKQEILLLAKDDLKDSFDPGTFNILTVGRISSEKGQDMIPEIVYKLINEGYHLCWYIVGDGDNREVVESLVKKFDVGNYVKLVGVRNNPYPYMKNCDLYVQPSYTEGYSTTICEAGILGKAIIGTEPSGAIREQITSGEDGLIVAADVDSIAAAVKCMITNSELRLSFERNILKKNFEGTGEINKFLNYLQC